MLLDLPPFFINPLDDQPIKSGFLRCYEDKARLRLSKEFAIKDGWLSPNAAMVLPAGYYSLFDQNLLRLMDFESYYQTNQGEQEKILRDAKDEMQDAIIDSMRPFQSVMNPNRELFTGKIVNDPVYEGDLSFTEDRSAEKIYTWYNDNGWEFMFKDELGTVEGRLNINLAITFEKQRDYTNTFCSVTLYNNRYFFGLTENSIVRISESSIKIEDLRCVRIPMPSTDQKIDIILDNPNANVPQELKYNHNINNAWQRLFSAKSNDYAFGAKSKLLRRQSEMPIPAVFRGRHKFYEASNGQVYWGGAYEL